MRGRENSSHRRRKRMRGREEQGPAGARSFLCSSDPSRSVCSSCCWQELCGGSCSDDFHCLLIIVMARGHNS